MLPTFRDSAREESTVNPDDLDEIDGLFFDGEPEARSSRAPDRHCRIIALISTQGGTGKTSIAVTLAGMLDSRRRRAAVLDLDPRRSVRRWVEAGDGLPFHLLEFDASRGAAAFRRSLRQAVLEVDLLIIDTPPALGPASKLALQVADLVLIPSGASKLDINATEEAWEAARAARHGRRGDLPHVMVVPSRQDSRTRLARDFAPQLQAIHVPVTPPVSQRIEVAMAAGSGRLVRSRSPAGVEFRRLARHVWSYLQEMPA